MSNRKQRRTAPSGTLTRRQVLQTLGAGAGLALFDPVSALIDGLVRGAALESRARAAGSEPRKYVFVYLDSGPARWHFDLTLNPHQTGNDVVRNGGLNNGFVNGQPAFLSVPVSAGGETINMPPLWGCGLPRPGGGLVPMAKLAENMLIIRGYDMQSDGHINNRIKQIYPLNGAPSLNGLVADGSTAPLPAVSLAGGVIDEAYFSSQGVGILAWNQGDTTRSPLQQFLDPFLLEAATRANPLYAGRKALADKIDAALSKMQAAGVARNSGAKGIFRDRASAAKLMATELGDLASVYGTLAAKYKALITAAMAANIPNVNDAPVMGAALQPGHRNVFTPTGATAALENGDLRSVFKGDTTVLALAEGFAVAEFLLTRKYGAAVSVNASLPANLAYVLGGAAVNANYNLDDHVGGTAASTLVLAFYYRSIAACVYELIAQLKAKQLWDDSVIHVASEFSRSPRADGTGSDHGYEANVTSIFSGALKKPLILGNVRASGSVTTAAIAAYNGTWGAAAPVALDNTTGALNIGHITSTVADLLRVERPMKNFSGVLEVKDSGIAPLIEVAKNA